MTAKETKLQDIIQGDKQFIVPLFQRTYTWDTKQWETLWNDIVELYDLPEEEEKPKTHFMGSIVNFPTNSVPEGVVKYLLIDGQQRLTTVIICLIAIRDLAKLSEDEDVITLSKELHQKFITNDLKKGSELYKVLPTQGDRESFEKLVNSKIYSQEHKSKIIGAYEFFQKKVKKTENLERLKTIICSRLSLVSITLDTDDNPYLVFESLNSKGEPLSPADLIRNYFFMCIHRDKQDEIYSEEWKPMQDNLQVHLTEFIRHFLMREGGYVRQVDIYSTVKNKVTPKNAIEKLQELTKFSFYYQCLVFPDFERDKQIQSYLKRLKRLDITTAFPLLLNFYELYDQKILSNIQFAEILKTLENYLLRRAVCGFPSNQLNKIFPETFKKLQQDYPNDLVLGLKSFLQTRGYPKDAEFRNSLMTAKFYGGSPLNIRTELILETIEQHFGHKEMINFETTKTSIEHIMPQTLSLQWQKHLGEDWEITYEINQHNLGNLTLVAVGYNSQMSNDNFENKRQVLINSHIDLNKYFQNINQWSREAIEVRSADLADKCLEIWSYFGTQTEASTSNDVTNTAPTGLWILGYEFQVGSWRDVLENTLNTIAELEPEKFEEITQEYPRFLGKNKDRFRAVRLLKNNYYIEVSLSAKDIQKFCLQAIGLVGLSSEEWKISTVKY